jgi:hypothetical protein
MSTSVRRFMKDIMKIGFSKRALYVSSILDAMNPM